MKVSVRIERTVEVEVPVGWSPRDVQALEELFRRLEEQHPELVPQVADDEGEAADWRVVVDWPPKIDVPQPSAPGGQA